MGKFQQILTDLKSGEAVTREPVYEKAGLSRNGTDDLNGSYIEVSLSQQHLWLYKDGALVTETDIISGLPTPERATYTGAYPIAYKASPSPFPVWSMDTRQPCSTGCPSSTARVSMMQAGSPPSAVTHIKPEAATAA